MKRVITLALTVLLVLSMVSCGGSTTPTTTAAPATTAAPTTTAAPAVTTAAPAAPAATTAAPAAAATTVAATTATEAVKHDPIHINIYTFSNGTFAYVMGMAWAELINENSDWITATAIEGQSSGTNELMMYDNPNMRANTIYYGVGNMAWKGFGDFVDKQNTRSKMVTCIGLIGNALVTMDPEIETLQDFVDKKKVMLQTAPRTQQQNGYNDALYKGATTGEMVYEYLDANGRTEAILSGRASGAVGVSYAMKPDLSEWVGNPATQEMFARANYIKFINFPREVDQVLQNDPNSVYYQHSMSVETVPAFAFHPQQTEPLNIEVTGAFFMADEDMNPDLVYEVLSIFGENHAALADFHPQASALSHEIMGLHTFPSEFHPGAMRYLNEKGVTPQHCRDYMLGILGRN